jgi:hypothetical protein
MTYRKILPVCSEIHSKHTNKILWAERRIFRRIRKIVKNDYYLSPVRLSARMALNKFSLNWDIFGYFENLSRKLMFGQNLTRLKGILHDAVRILMIISP